MNDSVDGGYERFKEEIRASKPRFEELIEDVTGWKGVEDLAEWMVRTLAINVGGSGAADLRHRLRCGCGNRPFDES